MFKEIYETAAITTIAKHDISWKIKNKVEQTQKLTQLKN